MKRTLHTVAILSIAAGCSGPNGADEDLLGVNAAALNGGLSSLGNLTKRTFREPNEVVRQNDTVAYYNSVGVAPDGGTSRGTIRSRLSTLSKFKGNYGFGLGETEAFYYNRGDLGIGREMHCVDKLNVPSRGEIACYVKNFFAGDEATEFAFGLSSSIAFANMKANNSFATVAMVYRDNAPAKDKVFFAVYDGDDNLLNETLLNAAALDRHGFAFNNEFVKLGGGTPNPKAFGTPGVHFNNHIPSNCLSCHGGKYNRTTHSVTGALFLPFNLNQFEFEDAPGRTREEQREAFKRLNEMARKVASVSGTAGASTIRAQLDGWYHNTKKQSSNRTEVFENPFDSGFVPSGWNQSAAARNVYTSVVRPYCRNCHVAVPPRFDSERELLDKAAQTVVDIANYDMPHALQTVREFWQSPAPVDLEKYFRAVGKVNEADFLAEWGGPGTYVTLDPHLIHATAAPL